MNASIIDPLELSSLPLLERSSLPNCPAIYFVLAGERILYIGRSVNLAQRWVSHHRWNQLTQMCPKARIAWIECNDSELLPKLEAALIERFKPELNSERVVSAVSLLKTCIGKDLRLRFKLACTAAERSMSDVVTELIEGWLEQREFPAASNQPKTKDAK